MDGTTPTKMVHVTLFLLLLIMSCLSFARFTSSQAKASSSLPVHNLNTGLNYSTVQEAINANETLDGQTITVDEGMYFENIVINKSIALVEASPSAPPPIIEGNFTDVAVSIQAPDVVLSGFIIRDSQTGILLDNANNSQIYGNLLEFNTVGAALNNSCNSIIRDNMLLSNYGIVVEGLSANNTVENNQITEWFDGIDVSSNNNTITGNSIVGNYNGLQSGISLSFASNDMISGNTIIANTYGISISWSTDITTTNNTLVRNTFPGSRVGFGQQGYGIYLYNTDNCSFSNNELDLNMIGIELWFCCNNTLSNNVLKDNDIGFQIDASSLEYFLQNIDTSNTVNGRPVYYLVNQHEFTVPNIAGWVAAINCSDITVEDLTTVPNEDGVLFAYTEDSVIANCTLSNNFNGVMLYSSSNCTISKTVISENGYAALYFDSSIDCTISDNNVLNNYCIFGMRHGSNGNRIFHNNFINNGWLGEFDPCQNSIDDGVSEGNYWTTYVGTNSNNDGIGNTPYSLYQSNIDNYPLMGVISEFNVASNQPVETISNSTISDFQFNGTALLFNVTGENGTTGFCRISFPTALINGTLTVFVNGTEVLYNFLPESNSTESYLYFTYSHSTEQVTIIPEFPTFILLPFFMIATSVPVSLYRKKVIPLKRL